MYIGDFLEDSTGLTHKFTTRDTTGEATALSSGTINVYKGSSTTPTTAGATLTSTFASVVGWNHIGIDLSSTTFYANAEEYSVVMSQGTVNSVDVTGETVFTFSIGHRIGSVLTTTDIADELGTYGASTHTSTDVDDSLNTYGASTTTPPTAAAIVNEWETQSQADPTGFHVNIKEADSQTVSAAAGVTLNAEIGASATAMDNFEDQYDTTGLVGDTFPATQSQLSGIANVGAAVHRPSSSYTLTTGTQSANTYTDTEALDSVRHEHTDDTGVMLIEYHFLIGAGSASSIQITGYVTGPNDDIDVYGYDWVSASYKQIGNIQGSSSTSNSVHGFDLFVDMTGSGANLGKVDIKLEKSSGLTSALLAVDQIFVAFNQGVEGYQNASIYFDSNVSNTNTVVGVDGTATNPVSSEAAVNTLLTATNLHRVAMDTTSSITFATTHTNEIWQGHGATIALGGQDVGGIHIFDANVSGTGTGSSEIDFHFCVIGTCTLAPFHITDSGLTGTITFSAAGNYIINNSHSGIAGATTPIIDTGAAIANVNLTMPDYHNGVEIRNLNATGTDLFSISGIGQIVYAANCSGAVNQRGSWKVTNTGGVTITEDDNTSSITLIEADTNELQVDWTNGGRLDLILDAVLAMLDDPRAEPGQGAPAVNADMATKLDYIYKAWRNKTEQTATTLSVYDDAGTTVDHKSTVSDDATTATKGEIVTGP